MLAVPAPSGQSVSVLGEVVALVAGHDAAPDAGAEGAPSTVFHATAESGVAGREGRDRTPGGGAEGAVVLPVALRSSVGRPHGNLRMHGVVPIPAARACARLCVFRL